MGKLILSEKDYAEKLLIHQVESKKVTSDLFILAKYYRDLGCTQAEIIQNLHAYMKNRYPKYDHIRWAGSIDAMTQTISDRYKYKLLDLDGIPIYLNEMDFIRSLNGKHLQNLAFAILVCGRYFHMANSNNDYWLNMSRGELFAVANISLRIEKQRSLLHKLIELGFIEMKFIRGAKIHLLYCDDSSPVALVVRNLNTIGNQFRQYLGEPYLTCPDCGDVVKKSSNRLKFCPPCSHLRRKRYKAMKQMEYRDQQMNE